MSQSRYQEQSRSPRLKDTKLHRAHAMQEAMQACRCHSVDRVPTSAGHGNEPLVSRKHAPVLYSVVAQYPSIFHPFEASALEESLCPRFSNQSVAKQARLPVRALHRCNFSCEARTKGECVSTFGRLSIASRPKRLFCPARTTPRASPFLALPLLTMAEEPKPQEAAAADAGAIHPLQ